jgi:hypothetical protein
MIWLLKLESCKLCLVHKVAFRFFLMCRIADACFKNPVFNQLKQPYNASVNSELCNVMALLVCYYPLTDQ